ncbi:cysteine proteinase [Trametes coccinea BRFM310]|uniref:ubiquitinyl hydrolase 1 n=1 Tax=Trametes coccinea (strain BRFM310) TaxID=1353009 RepID=A0A1Y2IDA0_TRAC3|nr:cysteine proteinase [Trametes coccinea BRFM310]
MDEPSRDLIGEPFAVVESDPGVFTTLIRRLGVRGLEVIELYSVEPYETDHLNPYGLILCYLCDSGEDTTNEFDADEELDDPDARPVWFANQLSDDACASQAILNVLLNCKGVDVGPVLREFAADTADMSPVMRGLAISNLPLIRQAQNSLARPADVRGAWHSLASSTLDSAKSKAKATASPPSKKRKTASSSSRSRRKSSSARAEEKLDAYHYIGYVPAHGRVWELNGLRTAGPLDVGEIDSDNPASRAGWMEIVRPVLQRRMQTVLQSGAEHIQYNLLAIVDDPYFRLSDELELLKRERAAIERRLGQSFAEGWSDKVDPALLASASEAFATTLRPRASEAGKVFAPDFGARKMEKELAVLDMPERKLVPAWENCVRAALSAKVAVEEEIAKSRSAQVRTSPIPVSAPWRVGPWHEAKSGRIDLFIQADHVRRTFDYEPFIREFITALENEGLLDQSLEDKPEARADGQPRPGPSAKPRAKGRKK